jgi:N-acetylglucosamine-6-phosphate deacetylase
MGELIITGATVLREGTWATGDLVCRDGLVVQGPVDTGADATRVDGSGLLVAPGFVDLQCNGGLGIDLTRAPGRLWELAAALPRWGVTAWLPTIVTAPEGAIDAALAALAAGPPPGWAGAVPLGLHLEGPFLSPAARGAHPEALLRRPTLDAIAGWSRSAGVAVVTLAPDLPGADEVLRELVSRDVVVALGHTPVSAAGATAAIDAGARWVTHLFNAMAPLHHRAPGLAGIALTDDRVHVGLIADGIHVHPAAVALAHRALGPRLTLVTDAVAALGRAPEPATGGVRRADGTLAGSDLPMDQAVRNLVAFTACDTATALRAATSAPAAVLGETARGHLGPGARADLVLLTPALQVVSTWTAGELVHDARRPRPPGSGPPAPI